MKMTLTRWGGLNVQVWGPERADQVRLNVVLCHGFGAPGDDLVPLGPAILQFQRSLSDRVRFLFPEAPLDLEAIGMPGGRAWWNLDIWKLQTAIAAGTYEELTHHAPAGLMAARDRYLQLLADCEQATGLPISRTVLGGFSQGAMLSTDVALQLPLAPAGLIVLSGSLINRNEWAERLKQRSGLPIVQSHGRYDQILPFEFAVRLKDELIAAGNPVKFLEFRGAHEIPFEVLEATAEFLAERTADAGAPGD